MSTANEPRKRLSSAARQAATDALAAAYADGQLTTEEFDLRTKQAWGATYADEVEHLTADLDVPSNDDLLPQNMPYAPLAPKANTSRALSMVTGERGGSAISVSVMSGVGRSGDWLVAPSHFSLALMGGTDLNLLKARFTEANTRINTLALMGGIRIIVPEDVRVLSEGFALMGGFEIHDDKSVTISQHDLPANAPTLTIGGLALMGGVEVVRMARNANPK
ncbi:DUF1707 SHOCT-like domain-containing protein [Corynebacterium riegelii]|uniref:DUF1707 SHOCT-like domain-containing protein n=1 Tax=Corynebacterium riegelii TaxID=156976 RepID=UPI0023F9F3C4|nr:DUF1707 domain-containing protein [Corynebacterium riegelii]